MRYPLDKFTETQWFNKPVGHGGLDMAAPCGTNIKSPVNGTVIGDGEDAGYIGGKYVIVKQTAKPNYEFYMGHMSSNNVVRGQSVKQGQVVGKVGKTGYATGCHVHFQIRKPGGGALIDPKSLKYDNISSMSYKNHTAKYWYERAQELRKQRNTLSTKLSNIKDTLFNGIKKVFGK